MAKPTIVSFTGSNSDLLVRKSLTNLDLDSEIVVPETHNAILIKDGQMMETLGGGRYHIFDKRTEKKSKSAEVQVIYLSKTCKLMSNWGTKDRFTFRDAYTDVPFEFGARGTFEVQISNPRKFYLELVGVDNGYTLEDLTERLLKRMTNKIQPVILKVIVEKQTAEGKLDFMCIDVYHDEMEQTAMDALSKMFTEEYGLKLYSFTLKFFMPEEFKTAIEAERKKRKQKEEDERERDRLEEKERLQKQEDEVKDDKDWERKKQMLELRQTDYEKYLEVCKIIGWEPKGRPEPTAAAGRFCSVCGTPYGPSDKFCPGCGKALSGKIVCDCGKENPVSAKFCSNCGKKL